jgi:hypothetical protein
MGPLDFTHIIYLAIGASATAGVLGLLGRIDPQWIGGIALLPNFLLLFARSHKFQEKSGWHYRKKNRLDDLKDQLRYQLPAAPSLEQIAAINKKKHRLNRDMQAEWDEDLRLNWSGIEQRQREAERESHKDYPQNRDKRLLAPSPL